MPAISAPDLDLLRSYQQKVYPYIWFLVPRTLWTARVNDATIEREETAIVFDGGAGAWDFSAVEAVQEVWVGTGPGLDDIGRARIRAIASGDGGVTGTLTVARNPLVWVDDAYLTFKHDYPLKPVYSLLGNDGTFYKDGDIVYSDQNEFPAPVAIGGEHRVGRLAAGTLTFNLPVGQSYAMKPGAAIVSRTVSVYPTAGVTVGAYAAGVIPVTLTIRGQYWAKITVTDDEGKSQITYRSLVALPPQGDPQTTGSGVLLSHKTFSDLQYSDDWATGGKSVSVSLHNKATVAEIPDNTLAVVFQQAYYGLTAANITFSPDSANTIMVGYVRKEGVNQDLTAGTGRADFVIETVEAQLSKHNFSVSLEALSNPAFWYEYLVNLSCGQTAHHFLSWHSTLFYVADVLGLRDNNDFRAFSQLQAGTLYEIINSFCYQTGIRAKLVSDKGGRLRLVQDVQLLTDAERNALTIVADLDKVDLRETISIDRRPILQVPAVYVSGFYWDTSFDAEGKPAVVPLCAKAPGNVEADDGVNPANYDRQTLRGQDHANEIAARFFARDNNELPEYTVGLKGNLLGVLDTAYAEWWRTSIAASDTVRGIVVTNGKMLVRNVQARFDGTAGAYEIEATFEFEALQPPGVPGNCMDTLPSTTGGPVPTPTPDPEQGGGTVIVTGSAPGSVHYLPPGLSSWIQRTTQSTLDLRVDPFWMIKQASSNPAKLIFYRSGSGYVKKTLSAGVSESVITPPNPPNDAGDVPAPTSADLSYSFMDVSWTTQDRLIVMGTWQNGGGNWRTWLCISDDEGATWTQTQISIAGAGPTLTPDHVEGLAWEVNSGTRFRALDSGGGIMVLRNTTSSFATTNISLFGIELDGDVSTQLNMGGSSLGEDMVALTASDFIVARSTAGGAAAINYITGGVGGFTNADVKNVPSPVGPPDAATPRVAVLSGTEFMVAYTNITSLYDYGAYFTIGEIVGGLIEFPDWSDAVLIEAYTPPDTIVILDLIPLGGGSAMVIYGTSAGTFARTLTSGGGVGAATQLVDIGINQTVKPCAIPYSGDVLVAGTFGGNVRLMLVSSPGTPSDVVIGSNPVIAQIDGQLFLAYSAIGGGKAVTLTDNSGVFTADEDVAIYDSLSAGSKAMIGFSGDPVVIYNKSVAPAENRINRLVYTPGSGYGGGDGYTFRGLGVALSRAAGNTVWTTLWTDDKIIMMKFDTSLNFDSYKELGGATLAEIADRTWWAYPVAPFSSEAICNFFGRLDNPQGLGSPVQIIRTTDGGDSWELYEGSWGDHRCAALVITPAGVRYAIRALGSSAKLYSGSGSLALKSSLPLSAAVAPHGLAVQLETGLVVAGADDAGTKMVVMALPPYSSWSDITGNHELSKGINSAEVV